MRFCYNSIKDDALKLLKMMNSILVTLHISPQDYIKQYQIPGVMVHTHASDGRRVQFPASILKPFLLHEGIHGRFRINFSQNGKFKSIERSS